ncbi:MAG: type VII secretion integral membrane protein EccD, partial [Actinomycetota bacterium]|nr:type VII secretion integral membrane protein EccD [Actinomycetota bacterium]
MTVHAAGLPGGRTDSETDLMLPAGCPLGVLMPAIVDEVVGAAGAGPLHWRLSRVGGRELDTAISLGEQDVGDGALLLLSTVNSTAPQRTHRDPAGAVAAAAERSAAALHGMAPWAVAAFGVISAAILVWSGTAAATATHPWVAGGLSAGTAAAALTAARSGLRPAAPLGSSAVVFAVAAGLLAVPHSPWAATLLLAAAAGLAVSTTMLRTACRGSAALCALATLTGCLAAVSALCTVSGAPIATAGAVLVVLALAGLSAAARLTVAAAGLGPMRGEVDDTRAAVAHGVLTGLVTGFAGAAALGVGAVAVSGVLGSSWTVPALFAAD